MLWCVLAGGLARGAVTGDRTLADAWSDYRTAYVAPDGRVVDHGAGDRTTSEGQAYALVRAVWADDPDTFERVRAWTQANLQGGDRGQLPAWDWGRTPEGAWTVRDAMPAADADEWMAWALLGAADKWSRPAYAVQALALLDRIWEEETLVVAGRRVVLPGPWAKKLDPVQLNPSYWLPFAWRTFAKADPAHAWDSLIDPAYDLLVACEARGALPPDWCYVRAGDGRVVAAPRGAEAHDDFGFEAVRIGWTLAAEVAWNHDPRAKRLLRGFGALAARWRAEGSVPAVLAPDGRGRVTWDYPGMYGAVLPAWGLLQPAIARAMWTERLVPSRAAHGWGELGDYYGQNWIWLGYALWTGAATPMGPR